MRRFRVAVVKYRSHERSLRAVNGRGGFKQQLLNVPRQFRPSLKGCFAQQVLYFDSGHMERLQFFQAEFFVAQTLIFGMATGSISQCS